MSSFGSQIIYKQLLKRHGRIRIPKIQRDYAQGRPSENEVLGDFLAALGGAINKSPDDPTLPLNLDFIYGSVEGVDETRFLPLDGQQRLTTLFLLHWYLAWKDHQWDEFGQMFRLNGHSRFSYSVRTSSNEFFDELVAYKPDKQPENVRKLSELIADQPWYFRSWRLDPTIQSVLAVLDAIHSRFASEDGLFERLTNENQPAITFQLLDLDNFGLSDDLYIKMNARGKPLTPFETFKARFEQVLKDLFGEETHKIGDQEFPIDEFFSRRMDTKWADFLWPYRDTDTNVFDEAIMNLFRTVVLITRSPVSESYIEDVTLLRNENIHNAYQLFHQRGWLDRRFSEVLILLLETWSNGVDGFGSQLPSTKYFDENDAFEKAIQQPTDFGYEELVQLAGYANFLLENEGDFDPEEFQEWMRVVFNLSANTEYNRPADLQRSIGGLLNLTAQMKDILGHFANDEKPATGFSLPQIAEEKLKAQLIVEKPYWRTLIDQAEAHGYFRGQIEFLLDFSEAKTSADSAGVASWEEAKHLRLQQQFSGYLQKAEAMFTRKGLKDIPDFRWERALLSLGDYLLERGRNYSYLVNSQTDQASWKRLLRGTGPNGNEAKKLLCELWKRLDTTDNLTAQLDAIIAGASDLEPWRDALVRTPSAISYCRKRLIRWNNEHQVYLLQTTQMNGTHAELFTYCLYTNMLNNLSKYGRLEPLRLSYYSSVGTDLEPGVLLIFSYDHTSLQFEIEFNGQFIISILSDKVSKFPLIESTLVDGLGFKKRVWSYSKASTPDLIESSVLELAKKLATIPSPRQNND